MWFLDNWKLVLSGIVSVIIFLMYIEIQSQSSTIKELNNDISKKDSKIKGLNKDLNSTKEFNKTQTNTFNQQTQMKEKIILLLRKDLKTSNQMIEKLKSTKTEIIKINNCDINTTEIDRKDITGTIIQHIGY